MYAYDALGNHVLIRDNVKHLSDAGMPSDDPMDIDRTAARETVFTFDEQGRQLTRTLPEGQIEEKRYDELGRLDIEISFEGIVTQYVYATATGSGERLGAENGTGPIRATKCIWITVYCTRILAHAGLS